MITRWGANIEKDKVLLEYPRPQMRRNSYINLNGMWQYAIVRGESLPDKIDGEILVPFSPECELSGVHRTVGPEDTLWYVKNFSLPADFNIGRVLLHFGAVDQIATVYLNGMEVGSHIGGYTPFSIDITRELREENQLTVKVRDVTDTSWHTRGKQKIRKGGIWYTPQSGIWQTVWLEAVPKSYVRNLRITPDFDGAAVDISAEIVGDEDAYAHFGGESYLLPARIPVPDFEPWSPEHPKLYGFSVTCGEDEVQSYFAMRKFSVEKDKDGVARLFLNNEPYFHNGLLDQGYWPDGLYTAPTDEAMIYDITTAKAMGFNMLRKHIKVEPLRWYYHCDRYGMLVWQDMPNGGGKYNPVVISAPLVTGINLKDSAYGLFARTSAEGRSQYRAELGAMVRHLYNCPCIAMWVPFNEGWGQFDAAKMCQLINGLDTTRTIDHASGWHDQGIGQIKSLHVYFLEYKFKPDKLGRAVVLSEFGGYNHAVRSHRFSERNFGYKSFETAAQLQIALEELYGQQIAPAKAQGLSAAVYTQLSDVEDELNGLLTYDRKVVKMAPEVMRDIVNVGK